MAEFKLDYTAEEINEKLGKIDNNKAIIDVIELPTDNINENAFYRLLTAKWVSNGADVTTGNVYCVETLPAIGEVVTDGTMSYFIGYYSIADNDVYGYVDAALGSAFNTPAGWYPFNALAAISNQEFNGIMTDIEDDPHNGYFGVLLSYNFYIYKNGWSLVPFAYEKMPAFDIQWDGVIGDKFALDLTLLGFPNTYFVKVSDEVFTVEQLVGAKFTQSNGGEWYLTSDNIDAVTYSGGLNVNEGVMVVYSQEDLNATLGLPSGYITNGTYFVYIVDAQYTNRLVAPSKITKIDEKFLPDMSVDVSSLGLHSVATTGNYNSLNNRPTIYTDVIRYNTTQNLNSNYKQLARTNIDVYSKSEVDTKIANGGSVDLSGYAKTTDVETMIANAIGTAIGGSY